MQAHWSHMGEIISSWYPPYKVSYGIDTYFHEFTINADNKPMLFPDSIIYGYHGWYEFLKTSRKLYDIAVAGVQYTLWMALQIPMSNDSKIGFPVIDIDPLRKYSIDELLISASMVNQVYNLPKMYELIKEYVPLIISAWQPDKPGLNLAEIGKDDPTRVGQLTIYGKANVWDLRHIAEQIEKWEVFSPADGMYIWQPSWVFTKS